MKGNPQHNGRKTSEAGCHIHAKRNARVCRASPSSRKVCRCSFSCTLLLYAVTCEQAFHYGFLPQDTGLKKSIQLNSQIG